MIQQENFKIFLLFVLNIYFKSQHLQLSRIRDILLARSIFFIPKLF